MQKPWIAATVGQGSSASFWNVAWPRRIASLTVPGGRFLEFLQVGAGDEAGCFGRRITTPLGGSIADALDQVAQFQQHVLRHALTAAAGAIEGQHDDAVVADLGVPVAEAEPIEA
jgi:hypothetical protein